MSAKKAASKKSIHKWKEQFQWLNFTKDEKMVCTVCTSQEEKIRLMPNASISFIVGSSNYRLSTLKDHASSECHKRAVREEENKKAETEGRTLERQLITQTIPPGSAIREGFKKMSLNEQSALRKLFEIAYLIALKGHAFTDFKDLIELEKIHEVKFQAGSYENESACKDFIFTIAEYFFNKQILQKLKSVNFIAILCDGSTDKGIVEQEVLYVIFTDPETFKPTLTFFEVIAPQDSQDAAGLKQSIIDAFSKHSLEHLLEKIVFLSSDGASVNCGNNSGLIKLFQEDYEWISFIWCFSHRLELAIKDALKEFIEPVEESLRHLFYLYTKSSKKFRELKNLYHILQDQFDMCGSGIKPVKSSGTRWIDHKLRAMERLVEKFGLYTQHLENVIESTRNSKDKAVLQGKFNKLVDSKVLLRSALFLDILTEAKKFSLVTQKTDINIVNVVDCVQSTSNNYRKLLGKLKKSPGNVFNLLPTLKNVVNTIESNEDGDAIFQGQKMKYYIREKTFIENHVVDMVERISLCFERRYNGVISEDTGRSCKHRGRYR